MPKHILLVDDNPDFRELGSINLKAAGFEVTTAENGKECLEKLKTLKPDLLLLDVEMPLMNGMETFMAIKEDPVLKDLKVVFLTNLGDPVKEGMAADEKAAQDIGALGYLKKTDDLAHIVEEVKRYAGAE